MKGIEIFGKLIEYGKLWRLGVNETTIVSFYTDVTIGGTKLKAGTYGLFALVNKKDWKIIIHKNINGWRIANHDEVTNVAFIELPVEKTAKL